MKTENVSAVIDSCYSGGDKRGNLTIRSLGGGPQLQASPEEMEYQRQWLSRLNLDPQEYKRGVAKGIVIASSSSRWVST